MQTAKKTKRLWNQNNFNSPECATEFGARNQTIADWESFKQKHKNCFGKTPTKNIVERKIKKKGENNTLLFAIGYKCEIKTSYSVYTFKGKGETSEEALKKALQNANNKFPAKKISKQITPRNIKEKAVA